MHDGNCVEKNLSDEVVSINKAQVTGKGETAPE